MKKRISAFCFGIVLLAACNKKGGEQSVAAATDEAVKTVAVVSCGKEVITTKPTKVGETGIVLPVGTKLCIPKDESEVRVELPADYSFTMKEGEKAAPVVFATYTCLCSQSGSACQIFYLEGMGFGCLQSSCSGSCTGKFTYKGYTVDRVSYNADKAKFFDDANVQAAVSKMYEEAKGKPFVYCELPGMRFAIVNDEAKFMASSPVCDCDGTQACRLKVVNIPFMKSASVKIKIYYCEGPCNGCELTV